MDHNFLETKNQELRTAFCNNAQERIGLFGGTFDPIHLGHLILAYDALEELQLDKLLFIPAKISPYKKETPPAASPADRLAMLHLALQGESRFAIDDCELSREGPSYTIETVRALEKKYPAAAFIFLIGEDHVAKLSSWKESEVLQKKVTFALFARSTYTSGADFPLLPRRIDISSTEIRKRLAAGKSISHFLPTSVFHYLEKKSLYRSRASC